MHCGCILRSNVKILARGFRGLIYLDSGPFPKKFGNSQQNYEKAPNVVGNLLLQYWSGPLSLVQDCISRYG